MSETNFTSNQPEENSDVFYINVTALLRALLKKMWLIVSVALLCAAAGYIATRVLVEPTYQTYFSIYINNSTLSGITSITSNDITASQYLADTGADIINSNGIKDQVAEQVNMNESDILIYTSVNDSSGVLTVYVITTGAEDAYDCADALMDIVSEEIARIIEGSSVQIIDTPEVPTTFYQPNYIKNAIRGMLLGTILICGLIIIYELLNDKVKGKDDVERHFALVNMGTIPDITNVK